MAEPKNKLTLVQTSPRAVAAPVLRASIIEGTGGKYSGVRPVPTTLQKAIDKKAKLLANSAYELIQESIMREITFHCFIGERTEICLEDKAMDLVNRATLDSVLVPIVRNELESVLSDANLLVHFAERARDDIRKEVERFRGV